MEWVKAVFILVLLALGGNGVGWILQSSRLHHCADIS